MKNQVCGQTNCKFIFRSRKPLNSLHRSFTVKMSDHSTFFSHTHKNAPEYKAFGGREIFRSPKKSKLSVGQIEYFTFSLRAFHFRCDLVDDCLGVVDQ